MRAEGREGGGGTGGRGGRRGRAGARGRAPVPQGDGGAGRGGDGGAAGAHRLSWSHSTRSASVAVSAGYCIALRIEPPTSSVGSVWM